jgi:DNA-binding beta-propeller fold protein YncE
MTCRAIAIPGGGADRFRLLITPDGKTVYVGTDSGGLAPIHTATSTAGKVIPFKGTASPAFTPDSKTLYVVTFSKNERLEVVPVDTVTSRRGKPMLIHGARAASTWMGVAGRTLYVLVGGTAWIQRFDTATNRPERPASLRREKVQDSPPVPAALSDTTLYIGHGRMVIPVSTSSGKPGKPISLASTVGGLAYAHAAGTPGGNAVYAILDNDSLVPISTATNTTGKAITEIGKDDLKVTFTPDGKIALVLSGNGKLTWIRTATSKVIRSVSLPPLAGKELAVSYMAVTPDGKTLYLRREEHPMLAIQVATGQVRHPFSLDLISPIVISP